MVRIAVTLGRLHEMDPVDVVNKVYGKLPCSCSSERKVLAWPMLCPTMPPSVAVKKDADVVGTIGFKLLVKLLVLDSFGLSTADMHVFAE